MATLSKAQLQSALQRLGQVATAQGRTIRLMVLGGGAMVLGFDARASTRDLDVAILEPDSAAVRGWATTVAQELGWPPDWLNDAAKGFLVGTTTGPVVFTAPGIEVVRPVTEQLLAMKLCAWRDDLDVSDARRLLAEMTGSQQGIWSSLMPYLQPGRETKAKFAYDDLWESLHGGP